MLNKTTLSTLECNLCNVRETNFDIKRTKGTYGAKKKTETRKMAYNMILGNYFLSFVKSVFLRLRLCEIALKKMNEWS